MLEEQLIQTRDSCSCNWDKLIQRRLSCIRSRISCILKKDLTFPLPLYLLGFQRVESIL